MKRNFFIVFLGILFILNFSLIFAEEEIPWADFEKTFLVGELNLSNIKSNDLIQFDLKLLEELLSKEEDLDKVPDSILIKLDLLAREELSVLNENPNIKKTWFNSFEIEDLGGEIVQYYIESGDNLRRMITTKGEDSTNFPLENPLFKGAKIFPSGKIMLEDGTNISNSFVDHFGSEEGIPFFYLGEVIIGENSKLNFSMSSGRANILGEDYKGDFKIERRGEEIIIKNGLYADKFVRIISEEEYAEIDGFLKLDKNGVVLGNKSKYTLFTVSEGRSAKKILTYFVEKETRLFKNKQDCFGFSQSCIVESGDFLGYSSYFRKKLRQNYDSNLNFDLEDFLKKELASLKEERKESNGPYIDFINSIQRDYSSGNFDLDSYLETQGEINAKKGILILAKEGNFIEVISNENSVSKLEIENIEDSSIVNFYERKSNSNEQVIFNFGNFPFKVSGNYKKVETEILSNFKDKSGIQKTDYLFGGALYRKSSESQVKFPSILDLAEKKIGVVCGDTCYTSVRSIYDELKLNPRCVYSVQGSKERSQPSCSSCGCKIDSTGKCYDCPRSQYNLKPGDLVQVYNQNRGSSTGGHNMVFISWADRSRYLANFYDSPGSRTPLRERKNYDISPNKSPITVIWEPIKINN